MEKIVKGIEKLTKLLSKREIKTSETVKQLEEHDLSNTKQFSLNGQNCFVRIVDVKDGDTVVAVIPCFGEFYRFNVRLSGIDTQEMKSEDPIKKQKAIQARNRVLQLLKTNTKINIDREYTRKEVKDICAEEACIVWMKCYGFDKYGRLLADIYDNEHDRFSFSECLIHEGLAYSYDGGTKLQ